MNGALYNTETAHKVGTWDNGRYGNDFDFCAERLYRTKSGKYFLHGEGGGNSKYGEWHGNSGGPGEEIRPYSPAEAAKWAEDNLDADVYAAEFGEPEEAADGRKALNLSVSDETRQILERIKRDTGKSISAIVDELAANAK